MIASQGAVARVRKMTPRHTCGSINSDTKNRDGEATRTNATSTLDNAAIHGAKKAQKKARLPETALLDKSLVVGGLHVVLDRLNFNANLLRKRL